MSKLFLHQINMLNVVNLLLRQSKNATARATVFFVQMAVVPPSLALTSQPVFPVSFLMPCPIFPDTLTCPLDSLPLRSLSREYPLLSRYCSVSSLVPLQSRLPRS